MSNYWNNQVMLPAPELIAAMNGGNVVIGTLLYNPVKIVFDNQGTVPIVLSISTNGGASYVSWHTFPAGEAMILDEDLYSFPKGTVFRGNGASGNFSISYCYLPQ